MIPRTFPSIIEAFQTKMVVYVLPSITGLRAWIDYIPVKGVVTESATLANTYANGGYQVVKSLDSLTGLQAWIGYIPVYEDASYNKPWSTDAGGYIPVGGLFSIPSLFASGAKGVWYDPSDLTTLFQDSAGTTPVTAVEQPVGLMLDKSQGLVLGSELFASSVPSGTGWTGTNASAVGNVVTFSAQFGNRRNAQTTEADKWYRFTFKARRISGNTALNIFHENSPSGDYTAFTVTNTVATYQVTVRGRTGGGQVNFGVQDRNASGWGDLEVYDLTVTSLAGNHAFQATSASRPVLSARKNWLLATETLSTQNVTVLAGQMVLSFYGTGTVTLSGTSTAGPLVGTGVANRVSLTFTPTAGTLTLTVSGSVTQAQLEYVA